MQINLSGHHVEITEGIKDHIKAKLNKIASHYPSLIAMTVILGNERNVNTVEINTTYEGASISVTGSDDNLFAAIAITGKKLDSALSHRKGVLKANQHNKPVLEEPEPEMPEATLTAAEAALAANNESEEQTALAG